ncbi:hypothetical protein RB601_002032 [Gaeumannomyces tritici]
MQQRSKIRDASAATAKHQLPAMSDALPADYLHRIYAGVLGKLIGVYLGRPFENWTYAQIRDRLGPIHHYVHARLGLPLVVIDDDVSGTFAFVRALDEHAVSTSTPLTPAHVGATWLNHVIEKRSVFWWGGNGISTEHTAFLNLRRGLAPPRSGSASVNGRTVAEQIGAQIFIDGWALASPGNPAQAARLAAAAASVSHDGAAVHAAVLWAAMEAEAFVSRDVDHLLDTGLSFIPEDSPIARLVADVRIWNAELGPDAWEVTRRRIEKRYGYNKHAGICHVVPNHAVMVLALLAGGHDFSRAMHIVNTCGWDTDCNSGNVGCLVAVMHGLEGLDQHGDSLDWRGPLADRALISSADAGYSINNAARLAYDIANQARRLAGVEGNLKPPKGGAQFHFSLPGSVQGFMTGVSMPGSLAKVGHGQIDGVGALKIDVELGESGVDVFTDTFTPLEVLTVDRNYEMMASPLIYPGQRLKVVVGVGARGSGYVLVKLRVKAYDFNDTLFTTDSGGALIFELGAQEPGTILEWTVPEFLANKPIQQVGIAIVPLCGTTDSDAATPCRGTIWLHSLGCDIAAPRMELRRPSRDLATGSFDMWERAWVGSMDKVHKSLGRPFFMAHDSGEGLLYQGTRDWTDYTAAIDNFSIGLAAGPMGVAIRVQGMNRYYALVLRGSEPKPDGDASSVSREVAIIKARDAERTVLAMQRFDWELDAAYNLSISAVGSRMVGSVSRDRNADRVVLIEAVDEAPWRDTNYGCEFRGGGAGFVVTGGAVSADCLRITPAARQDAHQ